MSALAESLAQAIAEERAAKAQPMVKAAIPCLVCGKVISAENCRPHRQEWGGWLPEALRPIDGIDKRAQEIFDREP